MPEPDANEFFEEQTAQSRVKAIIVERYFDTWAGIIAAQQTRQGEADPRLVYLDLYAGRGVYKDGEPSVPVKILQKALAKQVYADRLIAIFNDKDPVIAGALSSAITAIPGIEKLRTAPTVWNQVVDEDILCRLKPILRAPTLAFVDPFGYKGLTLKLVNELLSSWGSDCIFFFNYQRINAALNNNVKGIHEHMCALFGPTRAGALKTTLDSKAVADRETMILDELTAALQESGSNRHVLPFCFNNGSRTTHHLVLATKHFKGYDVMKGIMSRASASEQGVPTLSFCPTEDSQQKFLFELNRPLDQLPAMLLADFQGRTLTMKQLYQQHSVGRRYMRPNYVDVLRDLEKTSRVQVAGRKGKQGFADELVVTFPPQKRS